MSKTKHTVMKTAEELLKDNAFICGGNTDAEKAFFKLGFEACKDQFQPTADTGKDAVTEAVEFGEWLNKNAYPSYDHNGIACGWNLHKGMDGNIYTTKELHTHYSKTKNNEQQ